METGLEKNVGQINVQKALDDYYVKTSIDHSEYGVVDTSVLTHPCGRRIWLKLHNAINEYLEGEDYRMLEMEDNEMVRVTYALSKCGWDINMGGLESNPLPFTVSRPQAIVKSGVPTAESTEHLFMFRLLKTNDYRELISKSCMEADGDSYYKMMVDMYSVSKKLGHRIDRAVYIAMDVQTGNIYSERIHYDEDSALQLIERFDWIRKSPNLPEALSSTPEGKFCSECRFSYFCHFSHETYSSHCRTCCHHSLEDDGTVTCGLDKEFGWGLGDIRGDIEKNGCAYHTFNPELVPYKFHDKESTPYACCFEMPNGSLVLNGYGGVESKDLHMTGRIVDDEGNPIESIPY